jgi:hypothetical protein
MEFAIADRSIMDTSSIVKNAQPPSRKILRLLIAIPMAVVFVGIGASIYTPFSLVGGMIMDSCSGDLIYVAWEVWLRFLWAVVMLVAALVPPILIVMERAKRWVLFSMAAGLMASITWYVFWFIIASFMC